MTQYAPTRDQTLRRTPLVPRQPSVLGTLMTLPLQWLVRAWVEHRDRRLLESLSDTQLRDIGIRRSQIPHAVRDGLPR